MADTCILLRLRRETVEDAYVNVPVTEGVLRPDAEPDGSRRPDVEWKIESSSTSPHPEQGPLPEGRRAYDVHR